MVPRTMPQALIDVTDGRLERLPVPNVLSELWELPKEIPEPDYQFIDEYLALLKRFRTFVTEIEEPISEENRQGLEVSSSVLFVLVGRLDEHIATVESLPKSVSWRQRIYDKLVDCANEIEDVAEVCELAVDDEFIEMIKGRLQSYIDAEEKH